MKSGYVSGNNLDISQRKSLIDTIALRKSRLLALLIHQKHSLILFSFLFFRLAGQNRQHWTFAVRILIT